MFDWLKHAFAVEPGGPVVPTEAEAALVSRLARAVVRRGLTSPALLALECSHNLNFFASQALVFFAPLLQLLFNRQEYDTVVGFLERRGSIEYMCRRLEALAEGDECGPGPAAISSTQSGERDG